MADIDVERKEGTNWLWWILGLILLALLIWWLIPDGEEEVAVTEPAPVVEPMTPATPAPVAVGGPTIAEVLANPQQYAGQSFSTGTVTVAEVVSDRGFWIENNGQRMFVVKNESPAAGTADVSGTADTRNSRDVNAGDMLQINGTLHTSPAEAQPPLDQQTQQRMQGQPIFLQANVADIQHMGG